MASVAVTYLYFDTKLVNTFGCFATVQYIFVCGHVIRFREPLDFI